MLWSVHTETFFILFYFKFILKMSSSAFISFHLPASNIFIQKIWTVRTVIWPSFWGTYLLMHDQRCLGGCSLLPKHLSVPQTFSKICSKGTSSLTLLEDISDMGSLHLLTFMLAGYLLKRDFLRLWGRTAVIFFRECKCQDHCSVSNSFPSPSCQPMACSKPLLRYLISQLSLALHSCLSALFHKLTSLASEKKALSIIPFLHSFRRALQSCHNSCLLESHQAEK